MWKNRFSGISRESRLTSACFFHSSLLRFMSLLNSLFPPTLDEIVFEGRNQAYGAYQLRHDYQRNLASAGAYTLALCALLLLLGAAWQRLHPAAKPVFTTTKIVEFTQIKPDDKIIKQAVRAQPKAAPRAPRPPQRTVAATPTEVVRDDQPQPLTKPEPQPLAAAVDGHAGLPTPIPATDPNLGTEPGGTVGGKGDDKGPPTTAPTSAEKFTWVEKMPEFAGGQAAMLRYLRDHLRYPRQALSAGMDGRVFLSFVVGADGRISDVQVLKGLGYGLDEEAQRVVRQMPAWTPGYQSQHAVAVRFTLPINFQIQ